VTSLPGDYELIVKLDDKKSEPTKFTLEKDAADQGQGEEGRGGEEESGRGEEVGGGFRRDGFLG
jgi:hypothetical protein